jgi:hypothetical protein
MAISELYEAKPRGWSWIHGHAKTIWAREIAATPDREARRLALQEVPPGDEQWVRTEVQRLWTLRRVEQGA